MALHSTVNRNTGFTANKLMLGRKTRQPIHLLLGLSPDVKTGKEEDLWVIELAENMSKIHHFAREKLKTAQLRQKRVYDLRFVEHTYNFGDIVYLYDSSIKVGHSKKLKAPWKWPFLIVEANAPLYKIRDRKNTKIVHHDRMKHCNDRHIPVWIKRLRYELFNRDETIPAELLEDTVLEPIHDDDLDKTLPYTEEFS